jgi:3-oxoacyl-[acyl-carrier-protein] synthase III
VAEAVRIESLGVYLPAKVMTTEELLASCRHRPRLDLERITGIHERRVAEGEYAVDLAVQAARRALAMSGHSAAELDVVVSASISKHHRENVFQLEPATAVLLRRAIGAGHAVAFDVVNACAGMLTGILVVQSMIRAGLARTGMVVSGEHNMPVARTATREVRHSLDKQLAALTIGDAGAALILDASPDPAVGFARVDLVTGAKHNTYCYSMPSPRGSGGILVTRARALQIKGNQHFPAYLKRCLDHAGWSLDDLDHLIPHQVSERAIRKGTRAVESHLGCAMPDIVRVAAGHYGNTTTTSHWVVLHDLIRDGLATDGQRVLLVSGASGIVIGHAALSLGDLPGRYRAALGRPA